MVWKGAWEALRETDSSILVTAGAGAGKTEFLAQKASYLLQTGICPAPKRILAISFKKMPPKTSPKGLQSVARDQARRFDSITLMPLPRGFWTGFVRLYLSRSMRPVRIRLLIRFVGIMTILLSDMAITE